MFAPESITDPGIIRKLICRALHIGNLIAPFFMTKAHKKLHFGSYAECKNSIDEERTRNARKKKDTTESCVWLIQRAKLGNTTKFCCSLVTWSSWKEIAQQFPGHPRWRFRGHRQKKQSGFCWEMVSEYVCPVHQMQPAGPKLPSELWKCNCQTKPKNNCHGCR